MSILSSRKWSPRKWNAAGAGLLVLAMSSGVTGAQAQSAQSTSLPAAARHDGQHDFDFLVGSWKIHLKRRLHPLTGSNEWVELDGTVVCQKVWDGRAELEQFDVDSPEKHIQIHGMALRIYNPKSHQWRIYWANADKGALDAQPVTGEFNNGRGEFFDQEEYEGRAIFVRYQWTTTAAGVPHFEQSYSPDGGKTWEVNWITEQTRVKP